MHLSSCSALVIARCLLCHGSSQATALCHYLFVLTWCHLAHVTWPVLPYVTVRVTLFLYSFTLLLSRDVVTRQLRFHFRYSLSFCCHALPITWRYCNPVSFFFNIRAIRWALGTINIRSLHQVHNTRVTPKLHDMRNTLYTRNLHLNSAPQIPVFYTRYT